MPASKLLLISGFLFLAGAVLNIGSTSALLLFVTAGLMFVTALNFRNAEKQDAEKQDAEKQDAEQQNAEKQNAEKQDKEEA